MRKKKEVSPEELAKLKEAAEAILAQSRMDMQISYPFVGAVSMELDIVPTRDRQNPTACTDGKSIFFDIDFLAGLSSEEVKFVLAHEVFHVVLGHSRRKNGRDHEMWNVAADLEINEMLKEDHLSVPRDCLLCDQFGFPLEEGAEEYYRRLLERGVGKRGGGEGNGSGRGHGGKISGQFDRHIDPTSGELTGGPAEKEQDKYGEVGEDADFNPGSFTEADEAHVREVVVAAAQAVKRNRGTLPGKIAEIVKRIVEPELDWRELLARYITHASGELSSWNRPNRRFVYSGTYLPSHEGRHLEVAIGLDTSGSTAGDMEKFLSEITGLLSSVDSYTMDLIHCDTKVQKVDHRESGEVWDPLNFEVHGGGGTTLRPIFTYIEEKGIAPDIIVMFTDGYIDRIPVEAANGVPTLWVLTGDGHKDDILFGDIAKFKA